jgi:glycosyltransferase involved in cell wall biosynthesis
MPTVSIVLPTYNGERYLRQSIDSCLNQTFYDLEVIVVIDGSTDASARIVESYSDQRLVLIKTPNQGLPQALNTGFARARGNYFSWTSDDNLFMPSAIEEMVIAIRMREKNGLVIAGYYVIDENGKVLMKKRTTCACFLYRAEDARLIEPYRSEYRWVEDVDFFMRLVNRAGPVYAIPKYLYKYRVHKNAMTSRHLSQRQLVSLKLYFDLVAHGIYLEKLERIFKDRLTRACLCKDQETADAILKFAEEKKVDFMQSLNQYYRFINTFPGHMFVRLWVSLTGRIRNAWRIVYFNPNFRKIAIANRR